jgi:hypothetical protein
MYSLNKRKNRDRPCACGHPMYILSLCTAEMFFFKQDNTCILQKICKFRLDLQRPNPKKSRCMEPYAGVVDYNLTLRPLQSRLQHIYDGQPYARVDHNSQSRTLDLASFDTSLEHKRKTLTKNKDFDCRNFDDRPKLNKDMV